MSRSSIAWASSPRASRDPEQWVGKQISQSTWDAVQTSSSGWAPSVTRDEIAYTIWKRLSSGWIVLAGVNQDSVDLTMSNETRGVALALIPWRTAVAIVFALLRICGVSRTLESLADAVIAFGRGQDCARPRSSIRSTPPQQP